VVILQVVAAAVARGQMQQVAQAVAVLARQQTEITQQQRQVLAVVVAVQVALLVATEQADLLL
jgi:hypothetical protein